MPEDFRIEGYRVLAGMRSSCTLIEDRGLWFEGTDGSHLLFPYLSGGIGSSESLESRANAPFADEIQFSPGVDPANATSRAGLPRMGFWRP